MRRRSPNESQTIQQLLISLEVNSVSRTRTFAAASLDFGLREDIDLVIDGLIIGLGSDGDGTNHAIVRVAFVAGGRAATIVVLKGHADFWRVLLFNFLPFDIDYCVASSKVRTFASFVQGFTAVFVFASRLCRKTSMELRRTKQRRPMCIAGSCLLRIKLRTLRSEIFSSAATCCWFSSKGLSGIHVKLVVPLICFCWRSSHSTIVALSI
jgi:hypothetical protein